MNILILINIISSFDEFMKVNRRLLTSVVIVGITAIAAIAGTAAYFTSTRTAQSNKFETGTIDLDVKSGGVVNQPFVLENLGDDANISGTKTYTIKNTGTLPGRLMLRLQNVANLENGCNDPETADEPNCANDTEGELGALINLQIARDGTNVVNSTLATANVGKVGNDWAGLTPIILQPDETTDVTLSWNLGRDEYGNNVQSDSVGFDANFRLIQKLSTGPTPSN
ncbi:hypothetical protein A2957_01110 [Candidatus Roizmanbacteria bacterium RIFCSPLOWO2_01_FULL_38_11]|uniref:Uncharacterized protein n=1 Tax=Candidatus Roizmanbacteria bacterium RIFCSPLOWO2_01_FULL_38_11 TaxID=1802060 RepID=A0A1F7INU7_9BACT|nr:MAG: hypothetical protein A2957_01110 [Candidatus Roizmanbacteria bacterium RIFCSPLOWO2_01_FULL_38_11]